MGSPAFTISEGKKSRWGPKQRYALGRCGRRYRGAAPCSLPSGVCAGIDLCPRIPQSGARRNICPFVSDAGFLLVNVFLEAQRTTKEPQSRAWGTTSVPRGRPFCSGAAGLAEAATAWTASAEGSAARVAFGTAACASSQLLCFWFQMDDLSSLIFSPRGASLVGTAAHARASCVFFGSG